MLPWEMLNSINILRIVICSTILLYSCTTDWKSRRAPNQLWYILGAAGILLVCAQLLLIDFDLMLIMFLLIGVIFIYVFVYLLFRMGAFGGADAKALIAIAIMFPVPPDVFLSGLYLPLSEAVRSPIFSLSVLGNAVVLTLIVPLCVLIYNLITSASEIPSNPLGAFTGYRMKLTDIRGKHVRLMHRYEDIDGKLQRKAVFSGREVDDETYRKLLKWNREGKLGDRVWVTPKLPFLIPITLGFLLAVIYGDILMQVIGAFLMR